MCIRFINRGGKAPKLQEKAITITSNGTTNVTPDTGYDGLSKIGITTNVSGNAPKITNGMKLGYSSSIPDNLNTSEVTDMNNMFTNSYMATMPLLDTSNATTMRAMFMNSSITTIPLLDTSNVTDMTNMFGRSSITTIPLLNTSNVTDMTSMFDRCTRLTTIPLLNTSNVTTMQGMFNGCNYLTTIPLLDTSNVTNMSSIFNGCNSLSNESLNNILLMCANSNVTGAYYKTLSYISLSATQKETCQTLSNYQTFLDAGWTV